MLRTATLALAIDSTYGFTAGTASGMRVSNVRAMSSPTMSAFFDFSATKLDGSEGSMAACKGKPTLILNVASL